MCARRSASSRDTPGSTGTCARAGSDHNKRAAVSFKGGSIWHAKYTLYLRPFMETVDQLNLGIGTRLQHTHFGPGVVVGVRYATYLVSFINHGIKEVDKNDPK